MGRDREGCVARAVAAQARLSVARTRLEPRRQPADERDDQGALARGAASGRAGGITIVVPATAGADGERNSLTPTATPSRAGATWEVIRAAAAVRAGKPESKHRAHPSSGQP